MFKEFSSSCQYLYLYHIAAILAELFAFYENLMKQDLNEIKIHVSFMRIVFKHEQPLLPAAKSLQSCPTLCDLIGGSP